MSDGIDAATVTEVLAAHVEAGLRCEHVERAAVGNGQETWLVDAVDRAGDPRGFVVRRSAPAGVLDDTDRAHEFETLRAVAGYGLPTPRVYWLETEPSVLQRPFFVMDRMPGRPPLPRLAEEAAAVARDLGRRLAQLHDARLGPPATDDVRATTRREIARWKRRYRDRRAGVVPMVGALLAWLEGNLPEPGVPPCLLWGDAGPHNVLVEQGRITAMLDWELSHPGHPLEDLGAAVWACLGRYPQEEVIAGYEDGSDAPVDRDLLAYFAVLSCVSRSIMQLAGIDSFVRGETNALNLAGLGLTLPVANLRRAAAYAGWPDVPAQNATDAAPEDPMRLRPDLGETLDGVARFLQMDVLPVTEATHLRRGLKTAVALLQASAQRGREELSRRAGLQARIDGLFDRLEAAGAVGPGAARDAAALEDATTRVESDPSLRECRDDVRHALLADLVARAASLAPVTRLYGRDVTAGPGFTC